MNKIQPDLSNVSWVPGPTATPPHKQPTTTDTLKFYWLTPLIGDSHHTLWIPSVKRTQATVRLHFTLLWTKFNQICPMCPGCQDLQRHHHTSKPQQLIHSSSSEIALYNMSLYPSTIHIMYIESWNTTKRLSMWDNAFHDLGAPVVEYFQDFLLRLDMKPCVHLVETNIFSLNPFIVRPTKIMNKNWA